MPSTSSPSSLRLEKPLSQRGHSFHRYYAKAKRTIKKAIIGNKDNRNLKMCFFDAGFFLIARKNGMTSSVEIKLRTSNTMVSWYFSRKSTSHSKKAINGLGSLN
jgi:hypothetical protein